MAALNEGFVEAAPMLSAFAEKQTFGNNAPAFCS
jgi:hypothetical protein